MSYSFRKMQRCSCCRARSGTYPSILPVLHASLQPAKVCSLAFTVIFPKQMSQVANTTGILREQLHSNGVVISDDMQMETIAQSSGYEQVVLLALQSGVDELAIANQLQFDPDIAAKTIAIVKKLLNEGKLTPARIDESYAHIVKCKERLGKIQ
jgi:beta-N-acetylhexosaminidase